MIQHRRPSVLLLCLLLLGLGPVRRAAADDTKKVCKTFRTALRRADWKAKRAAYLAIADRDSGEVVEEILDALAREENPAVVIAGIGVLAGFATEGARAALVEAVRKGKSNRKAYALMALSHQHGDASVPILTETVQGKDSVSAAQAALALGQKEVDASVPHLVGLLAHKDWQLRRAAAMALRNIAQPHAPRPRPGEETKAKAFKWPVPDFMRAPEVTQALVGALGIATGVDRQALVAALEAIHEVDLGLNLAAWKLVAAGRQVDERTLGKREHPPAAFGIPLYGKRIVLIYDNSLRAGDPHRFGTGDRLLELCQVPGSEKPIFPARLLTVGRFAQAHYERCIRDMPSGVEFELITFNETIKPLFGRFVGANAAKRKFVDELFETIRPDDGIATYGVLSQALDVGGSNLAKSWKRGPDEIVFVTCNQPTRGDITDTNVVAAAIALKARLQMVRVHTVGLESHPYDMLATMAKETGGVYRNYYE